MNEARAGTRGGKSRGLVKGGRSKPWRQKGTGRARAGTTRAPQWTGGGMAFPPNNRNFEVKVNRKARRAAFRSALSDHAKAGTFAVLDASSFEEPSTRKAARAARRLGEGAPDRRRRDGGRRGAHQVVPQRRARARHRSGRARSRRASSGRDRCSSARQRFRSCSHGRAPGTAPRRRVDRGGGRRVSNARLQLAFVGEPCFPTYPSS